MVRILKFILGFLAALLLLFFALGMFQKTVSYGTTMEVNKPLKESWEVFMDQSKMDQWLTGLQNMKLVEGEDKKSGSKYTFQFQEGKEAMEMQKTLTKVIPNERFEMTLSSVGMMSTDMVVTFKEKDASSTIIDSKCVATGDGMFMRSMFAVMHIMGGFDKSDAEMYGKLKKLIEENKDNYFPEPVEVEASATDM